MKAGAVTYINMVSSDEPACEKCAFSVLDLERGMVCRRHPPQQHPFPVQGHLGMTMQIVTAWPAVRKEDWCGEFFEKPDAIKHE